MRTIPAAAVSVRGLRLDRVSLRAERVRATTLKAGRPRRRDGSDPCVDSVNVDTLSGHLFVEQF